MRDIRRLIVPPGLQMLTFLGYCLGLIESVLYGLYIGLVFVPIYNSLARRWGTPAGDDSRHA